MKIKHLLTLTFIALGVNLDAQEQIEIKRGFSFGVDSIDVVYFSKKDKLPYDLLVLGKIIDVSSAAPCGTIFQFSRTIKVEIKKTDKSYPYALIYIVVPCLNENRDSLIGKEIKVNAKALFKNNENVPLILNRFPSGGVPFYWVTEDDRQRMHIGAP
jgi:hypothetical protein